MNWAFFTTIPGNMQIKIPHIMNLCEGWINLFGLSDPYQFYAKLLQHPCSVEGCVAFSEKASFDS